MSACRTWCGNFQEAECPESVVGDIQWRGNEQKQRKPEEYAVKEVFLDVASPHE